VELLAEMEVYAVGAAKYDTHTFRHSKAEDIASLAKSIRAYTPIAVDIDHMAIPVVMTVCNLQDDDDDDEPCAYMKHMDNPLQLQRSRWHVH